MNIIYGDSSVFDAVVYQNQNPANRTYFENQIQSIGSTLTDIGQSFFSNIQQLYDQANNSDALRIARAAIHKVESLFQPNIIKSIFELHDIQNAPVVMQRWVMANPSIRAMYQKQMIDGYSDTYYDPHRGDLLESHYDYRRVMDKVIQEDEDGWHVKFYPDDIIEGDTELTHEDKIDIISTWQIAEMFIKAGSDPTSAWDTKL